MTKLLEQAFREVQKLSADEQDALAQQILEDLRDEDRWSEQFERTTDDQWSRLAQQVRQQIAAGDTAPLEELLP